MVLVTRPSLILGSGLLFSSILSFFLIFMSNSIKIQWSEIIKRVQFKLKYRMAKERIHIYVLGKGLVKKIRQNTIYKEIFYLVINSCSAYLDYCTTQSSRKNVISNIIIFVNENITARYQISVIYICYKTIKTYISDLVGQYIKVQQLKVKTYDSH